MIPVDTLEQGLSFKIDSSTELSVCDGEKVEDADV